jgi:hypothetical protein
LQRQAEIYDLLDERLQVTPIELAQEREALLQRQYELHKQQPQSESTPRDDAR